MNAAAILQATRGTHLLYFIAHTYETIFYVKCTHKSSSVELFVCQRFDDFVDIQSYFVVNLQAVNSDKNVMNAACA